MSIRSNAPVLLSAATFINRNVHDNKPLLLKAAAGNILQTLPAAKGTGARFKFIVDTLLTSNTYAIAVTGTDFLFGGAFVNDTGDSTAATADFYPTAANSNRFTFTASIGAGKVGDWVEFTDISTGKWHVHGVIQGETDPATPFSNV